MAKKGPIIAAGAVTGALFFWRRKRRRNDRPAEQLHESAPAAEVPADA